MTLILAHIALRNYQEALRYADLVISIQPDFAWVYQYKFNVLCAQGNVSGARSALQDGHLKSWLLWMQLHELERDYRAALDSVGPRRGQHFAHDFGFWTADGMAGLLYQYMGDTVRAGEAFESSRAFLESHREQYGDYFGFHSTLGIAYAGLGRKEEAIRESKLSAEQFPISRDASIAPALIQELARIYVMVEEYDAAIELIDSLLSFPNLALSVGGLKTHPHWDPLRDHPRFQELIEKYEKIHGT
jgi:tetratricopeptide (TPR) repeat protein